MKKLKNLAVWIYLVAPLLSYGAVESSERLLINKAESSVSFLAIGKPSAIKIRGENGKPEGSLTFLKDGSISGDIKIDLQDFSTGIATRDQHMKEKYLEVQKDGNRIASMQFKKIDFPENFWTNHSSGDFPFVALLTLHGVTKEVKGNLKIDNHGADSLKGNSRFTLKLSDFGVQIPSFSGITVAENVDLSVDFKAQISNAK